MASVCFSSGALYSSLKKRPQKMTRSFELLGPQISSKSNALVSGLNHLDVTVCSSDIGYSTSIRFRCTHLRDKTRVRNTSGDVYMCCQNYELLARRGGLEDTAANRRISIQMESMLNEFQYRLTEGGFT